MRTILIAGFIVLTLLALGLWSLVAIGSACLEVEEDLVAVRAKSKPRHRELLPISDLARTLFRTPGESPRQLRYGRNNGDTQTASGQSPSRHLTRR